MGYVAVRGGGAAIEESLRLLELRRAEGGHSPSLESIKAAFRDLVDQVMGESSLYDPDLAALAIKQACGSVEEAVFLLRAFRSTLERPFESCPVDTAAMEADRRISAAFKDVPGGQVLGATRDYSHRLLDFSLAEETDKDLARKVRQLLSAMFSEVPEATGPAGLDGACPGTRSGAEPASAEAVSLASDSGDAVVAESASAESAASEGDGPFDGKLPKVLDYLRREGLLPQLADDDAPPMDVTMGLLEFPCPRSAWLQTLSRGMTQAVEALGYAAIRGYGPEHPTVGELRHGRVEVCVSPDPDADPADRYFLGSVPVTEVESVFSAPVVRDGKETMGFEVGYGLVMGGNETKAIAMSVLDRCLQLGDAAYPTQDQEFVLYHVDGVEAQGFISHLKLPHYVTFQSKLDAVRNVGEE